MRYTIVMTLVLTTLPPSFAQGMGNSVDRYTRMLFNASLPPNCLPGWFGRGIGLIATCHLAGRTHIRFIDGFILPCSLPDCRDHAERVEQFLYGKGF